MRITISHEVFSCVATIEGSNIKRQEVRLSRNWVDYHWSWDGSNFVTVNRLASLNQGQKKICCKSFEKRFSLTSGLAFSGLKGELYLWRGRECNVIDIFYEFQGSRKKVAVGFISHENRFVLSDKQYDFIPILLYMNLVVSLMTS